MKGGSSTKSPKREGAVHLFWLACLILFTISTPLASAWSFPFSLPFLSSADEEASLSLDLDRPTVEYGGSVNYTILLENSGREDLTDISISDNFGQVGFIALLPAGESFEIERTTPPLETSTQLRVDASSEGEEMGNAEAAVQVGLPSEVVSMEGRAFESAPGGDDQILRTMSASAEIDLVVGADPATVRSGEGTTVRMTVTNRGSLPLKAVDISGPGWTVDGGDLAPGESKTFSRAETVAEDLSTEIVATGTTDGGERASDQEQLSVGVRSSDLSVTVITAQAIPGGPTTTEYRLKNEGEEVLSRVTLKDGSGAVLGILPQLTTGESRSLTQTSSQSGEARGPFEVTATSPEGRTVKGEVTVQATTTKTATSSATHPEAGSGSSKSASVSADPASPFGSMPEFDMDVDMDLNFDEGDLGMDVFGAPSNPGGSVGVGSSESSGSEEPASDPGFGGFDMDLDFGDFGFAESLGPSTVPEQSTVPDGSGLNAPSAAETNTEGADGSPELVVTLQANKTLVHKGDDIRYRCSAVNRGTAPLADVEIRCAATMTTARNLAPGDGLPLEGVIRADGSINLTASASASGPDGSEINEEARLRIETISPELKMEVQKDPETVCRGQRVSIVVKLENSGDDTLTNVVASDGLGEIGTIPILRPGETKTLSRNSTVDESLKDDIMVVATDSAGDLLTRSQTLDIELFEPGLNLTVGPTTAAAYPGEDVEVVWTIKNSGKVDLLDVTMEVDGEESFRLASVAAGGATPVSSAHQALESRTVMGRAVARTAGGETISAETSFDIRVISPGISLNVRPSEVEATEDKPFNLTCLVTNSGNDLLRDVVLAERSLGTLENIGRLEPGDFKVVPFDFSAGTNTTLRLTATGIDSMGGRVNDSQEVAVKLVSADIELAVRAEPQETVPGGSVNVVCTVENRGDVPIFSTFITGESLGQLGTIDYISPGKSQTLERDIEVSEEMEEEISAEGFTRDGASVRDGDVLTVRLIEPVPPTEEPADPEVAEAVPSVTTRTAAEDAEPAETEREEIGLQKEVNESGTISDGAAVEESSGISGLIHRLKGILAKIRLTKGGSAAEGYAPETTSERGGSPSPASSTSASLPGTPAGLTGYGTGEAGGTNATALTPDGSLPVGAGYALPEDGARPEAATGNISPGTGGYSYSAEGPATSYLGGSETYPESAKEAYVASDPASAYLSSPWTAPGTAGYASSNSGPFSALTSTGGSPTIAGTGNPTIYESSDLRSASEASPTVAGSNASEYSSRHTRSEVSPGYAQASDPAGSLSLESPSQSKSPTNNIKLVIGDTSTLEIDRPPEIIDVGAFPPEPTAWEPVVLAVHASDDIGIISAEMLWDTPTTAISRLDLADVTEINTQPMEIEEGDEKEGYWSYEIPGQAAGTYMAVFIKVSDGERWAEDGPYILFWSEAAPEVEPEETAATEVVEPSGGGGSGKTAEPSKGGMLFVESTTVVGRGDVSIKNEVREDSARYKEELDGFGSIEMQSEKTINKGNPVVNITDSRVLVFDQGYLKGFKVMQSPGFNGGMGASVTERFNATTLEKSETGTISTVRHSQNTLLFNSQQAFEGIWGTRTEYSNFNKKIRADQTLNGTFETQKKITFED